MPEPDRDRLAFGQPVTMSTPVVDDAGEPVDPTAAELSVKLPSGLVIDLEPTQLASGEWGVAEWVPPIGGAYVYRIATTGPGAKVVEGEFIVDDVFTGSITPTPEQVHALIPTRAAGRPFSADTTPTRSQVATIAAQVSEALVVELPELTPAQRALARYVVTLGAAASVEDAFYPEQQADAPAAARLFRRYTDELQRLRDLVHGTGAAGGEPFTGTVSLRAGA